MSQLPIQQVLAELFSAIEVSNQVILKAATGAGKSTYFPLQLLLERHIDGKIIMLEPRRVAAKSIASYLAQCLDEPVGQRVGYRIRGDNRVSNATQLEIVTEGVLTRMLQTDPELEGVGAILFDEFHERSLHADTALAFTLEIQEALRDDLKIVVMSATLEADDLLAILPQARFIESQGRSYPVEVQYQPLGANEHLPQAMSKQIQRLLQQQQGSLLAFLPGVGAIKRIAELLREANIEAEICPLYGQLDLSSQQKALRPAPTGQRKVVLATNIAETSLTIEGVRMVVDSGLENLATFDIRSGITKLEPARIAQSSAIQRAGRAGRLEPGICVRLYSESQFQSQSKQSEPEIVRSDLTQLQLELIKWGCSDVNQLHWIDVPNAASLERAQQLLTQLQLIDNRTQLTTLGTQAYGLGVDARWASILLQCQLLQRQLSQSQRSQCQQQGGQPLSTAIALCVLMEEPERSVIDLSLSLHRWQVKTHPRHQMLSKRAKALAERLQHTFQLQQVDESLLGMIAALGYPDRIANQRHKESGQYLLSSGHGASLNIEDKLSEQRYLVALNLMRTSVGSSQIFQALPLDIEQLLTSYPQLFVSQDIVEWDDSKGKFVAYHRCQLGRITVHQKSVPVPEDADVERALVDYVRRKGLAILNWTAESKAFVERVECARQWLPEYGWSSLSDQALLDDLEQWLAPYMSQTKSVKQLQQIRLLEALQARLGWELQTRLDEWLPTHIQVASGNRHKIRYQFGQPPMLSVKLQEMFGEKSSPMIAQGQQAVVLELLSPAQRPLQITQDLAAFWQGAYKEVQKEMKGRYPKHPWPDDPVNHQATSKTKRQLKS
ncbi:ATP-dependent helicase HrpB [Vibrio hippocampi]|uniref:ATP-dependent RNA helicase HrpB n=1 Tax=Vibrio hippocampi TaxID=654686 RepID=A0ABM8ZK18_9VIBR|nr:ATP-dependent helicase HrpB [Vibrio hippocampi]CAH0527105.1 ATP-dependent RNA helicase HrpB [Vibrio hippocampi]